MLPISSVVDIRSCASNQNLQYFWSRVIRHWVAAIQIKQMPTRHAPVLKNHREKQKSKRKYSLDSIKYQFTCCMVCVEHNAFCAVIENIKPFKSHV